MMCEIPCPRLPYNIQGTTYTVLKYPEDINSSIATIPTTLKFVARDCDPSTGIPDTEQGYQDEYMVNIKIENALLITNNDGSNPIKIYNLNDVMILKLRIISFFIHFNPMNWTFNISTNLLIGLEYTRFLLGILN